MKRIDLKKTYQRLKNFLLAITMIFAHFKTISNDPGKFILWILTSVILSLSTVWLPTCLGILLDKDFFGKLMENNPFIVFSVVFLSNSVLTSINYIGAGTNRLAVAIRGITLVLTIMYLIFLSSIIPLKLLNNISLSRNVQFVLLGITLFLGIYVYGFRDASWEKSVDDMRETEDEEVSTMASMASQATQTEQGIKL